MTERAQNERSGIFDVAVVGGGVVGCATFREFTLAGASSVLLERNADLIDGASKGNSGLLHTGFDATPGSVEAKCVRDGYRAYVELHERLNLPLLATGAALVAWSPFEQDKLPAIVARAHDNKVFDVRQISQDELREREPGLSPSALGGIIVPGESIVDPWSAPLAYALQGLLNGGTIQRDTEVLAGKLENEIWRLSTTKGEIRARVVVNCSGNYGDLVEAIARQSPFSIRPRKGQFVVFDKSAFGLVQGIVLPVPTERTKGVVVSRTAYGNLIVGPTAEDQEDRSKAAVDRESLVSLIAQGVKMMPALAAQQVTATYAGLRPATPQTKDYILEALPGRRWITASGIRSTGLTGSLGIAKHLRELYEEHFAALLPIQDPIWPRVPNLAEGRERRALQPGHSEIVCHCESVTREDIEEALAGPLPARSLGGLKRRTRCMMGRCQGFYCTRRVLEIVDGRIPALFAPAAEGDAAA